MTTRQQSRNAQRTANVGNPYHRNAGDCTLHSVKNNPAARSGASRVGMSRRDSRIVTFSARDCECPAASPDEIGKEQLCKRSGS
jgi:hypothetical protein